MEYREIKYYYKKWLTWDNQEASAFVCSDKDLLRHVSTISFESKTLEELQETIDYYLDNVDECKDARELTNLACEEFYQNNPTTPKD